MTKPPIACWSVAVKISDARRVVGKREREGGAWITVRSDRGELKLVRGDLRSRNRFVRDVRPPMGVASNCGL